MSKQSDLVSVSQGASGDPLYIDTTNDRVGVKTSSPASALHIDAADSAAGGFRMKNTAGESVEFYYASSAADSDFVINRTGSGAADIVLKHNGYLRCPGVYNDSAADSANVVVDGSGNIYRSTSALKYKQDIRDIEEIDINQFRPVRYKSNLERDDQTKDHFGFIADEAHDAGYTELVSYGVPDEETGVSEVEGFRYDRMTVLLTKVIQQQQATIDALEARVAALEAN